VRTALQLLGRVARLEAEARDATTPTVGATIADILSGRRPGPRTTDEQMARSATGRLLLERRQRWAEADYPER
jgi:hypothetical protein